VWEPEPARVYSWERSGDGETGSVARPLAGTGA
jgi:hypothetical protein